VQVGPLYRVIALASGPDQGLTSVVGIEVSAMKAGIRYRRVATVESVVKPPRGHRGAFRAGAHVLVWAALTGTLIALGEGVVHSTALTAFDRHVTSTVVAHRTPVLNATMKAVTWLGSWVALVVVGIMVIGLAVRRRIHPLVVVIAVVAWGGESGAVAIAKHVVGRHRPPEAVRLVTAHGWSFPSGHTAVAAVVFATLAAVTSYLASNRTLTVVAWGVGAVLVALVAYSRIELGVHWATDVIASLVFMAAWLTLVPWLLVPLFRSPLLAHDPQRGRPAPKGCTTPPSAVDVALALRQGV
jgi:undecaprenyl-diphosphatase